MGDGDSDSDSDNHGPQRPPTAPKHTSKGEYIMVTARNYTTLCLGTTYRDGSLTCKCSLIDTAGA